MSGGGALNLKLVSAAEVARLLPYSDCIPLMREAMIALPPPAMSV